MANHIRRPVVTFVILSVGLGVLAFSLRPLTQKGPARLPQQDLQVRVSPSTFLVEARHNFVIKAASDFASPCERIEASIAELGWQQSMTRKELFDGARSELNPAHTGTYQVAFTCDGREIGSAPISVVIGPELAARPIYTWWLSSGKPRYTEGSFYCVPVTIGAMVSRGGATPVPASVARDTHFALRDLKAQAPTRSW